MRSGATTARERARYGLTSGTYPVTVIPGIEASFLTKCCGWCPTMRNSISLHRSVQRGIPSLEGPVQGYRIRHLRTPTATFCEEACLDSWYYGHRVRAGREAVPRPLSGGGGATSHCPGYSEQGSGSPGDGQGSGRIRGTREDLWGIRSDGSHGLRRRGRLRERHPANRREARRAWDP